MQYDQNIMIFSVVQIRIQQSYFYTWVLFQRLPCKKNYGNHIKIGDRSHQYIWIELPVVM